MRSILICLLLASSIPAFAEVQTITCKGINTNVRFKMTNGTLTSSKPKSKLTFAGANVTMTGIEPFTDGEITEAVTFPRSLLGQNGPFHARGYACASACVNEAVECTSSVR